MDERLKDLMQDLGNAINESLSDSDRIAEAIGEIKRAKMLKHFGSVEAIAEATDAALEEVGLSRESITALRKTLA